MKKNIVTILLSVLLSGLVAYGVGKSTNETVNSNPDTASGALTSPYRTVNLTLDDYPDFTFAAENAVDAVVFVKVTIKARPSSIRATISSVSSSATSSASRGSRRSAVRASSSVLTAIS